MFHVKHSHTEYLNTDTLRQTGTCRRVPVAVLSIAIIVLALLAVACGGIASPQGWASPVEGASVLLVSHRDKLHTVDPETLEDSQLFPPDPNDDDIDAVALYGDPAIFGDRVFVPTHDKRLYAIELEGSLLWPAPFEADGDLIGGVLFQAEDDADSENPAGMLYLGSDDGNVYAVESDAGILQWTFETGNGIWSTPVFFEGILYVTSLDGSLYALDAEDGTLLWSFETHAGIASTPVINEADRLVYVGGFDSRLRAIDIDTQEQRWEIHVNNWFWTRPLLSDGVVYAGSLDSTVHAVDAATGESVWAVPYETEGPVRAAPLLVAGVLLIVDRDGNVYAIDPETGRDAFGGALVLDDDVYADPILRVTEQDGERRETALVMTTGGDLVEVDPETLRVADTVVIGD